MVQYKLQDKQLDYAKLEDLIQCVKEAYKSKLYYKKFLINFLYYNANLKSSFIFKLPIDITFF